MRLYPGDLELLATLASMPFLDRLELAAVTGRSRAAVYERIDRFADARLVDMVGHSSDLITPTRRFCLSALGVRRLAPERGTPVPELLRAAPVSSQWRRLILERLDAVAVIYRLSATAAEFAYPLGFRWYRASPMDAALELPDGRRVAVVRQGRTTDRTAFAKRIRRLCETPGFGAVLLLGPDETRLRHARRLVSGPLVITFLALERDVALSGADANIWRGPSGSARLTLKEALSFAVPATGSRAERPLARVSMPEPLDASGAARPWLMPAVFSAAEKRTLELVADWPLDQAAASLWPAWRRQAPALAAALPPRRVRTRHPGWPSGTSSAGALRSRSRLRRPARPHVRGHRAEPLER